MGSTPLDTPSAFGSCIAAMLEANSGDFKGALVTQQNAIDAFRRNVKSSGLHDHIIDSSKKRLEGFRKKEISEVPVAAVFP